EVTPNCITNCGGLPGRGCEFSNARPNTSTWGLRLDIVGGTIRFFLITSITAHVQSHSTAVAPETLAMPYLIETFYLFQGVNNLLAVGAQLVDTHRQPDTPRGKKIVNKLCTHCKEIVYPLEQIKCLDQIWHRKCFRCHSCGMALNMSSYRGYEKKPYCSAHYIQPKPPR
ncbi:uncharacterized protein DEA37_0000733, partial [Paragonimus westermani]